MFGLGLSELIIIAAIGLVFLGPEKFPEFAKIALRAFRDLRGYVDDIKREMAEELNPVKNELTKLAQIDTEDYVAPIPQALSEVEKEISENATATDTNNAELNSADTNTADQSETPVTEDPYKESSSNTPSDSQEDIGPFSEGNRYPEPTPGGDGRPGPDEYPD